MQSHSHSVCIVPWQGEAKMDPGSDVSVRGGWDPPCHQCHSVCSQGIAALTSAPTEFRQVTGRPVGEATDCHPMSDYSILIEQSPQITLWFILELPWQLMST